MSETIITPNQIKSVLDVFVPQRLPLLFVGLPGTGKTTQCYEWGMEKFKQYGTGVIDIRCSQHDSVDFTGLPFKTDDGFTAFAHPDMLPYADRDGEFGMLLCDEYLDASQAVQVATQQLIHERRIGGYKLPDGWTVVALGNKREHGGVNRGIPEPLKSRFKIFEVEVSPSDLQTYMVRKGCDPALISFLKRFPHLIHNMPEDKGASWSFPDPRAWEQLSNLKTSNPDALKDPNMRRILYSGIVGEGAASEFIAHEQVADHIPDPHDVIANPTTAMVPENPSATYAIAIAMSHWVTVDNAESVFKYLSRLPSEYAVTSITEARKIKPEIQETEAFVEWVTNNTDLLGV